MLQNNRRFLNRTVACTTAILAAGCQTVPVAVETVGPICVPLETKAQFSCWWSAVDAPLTHCVMVSEDDPRCGMKAKAGVYLNRGARTAMDAAYNQRGVWFILSIYEDSEGNIGTLAYLPDGTARLNHHSSSPVPTAAPIPPRWPRFPSGLEFGTEQVRK